MKTKLIVAVGISLLVALAVVWAQPRQSAPGREFMRQKLDHAQSVLEGITMEDFDLVIAHARRLRAMSDEATWRTFENPEYIRESELFRRQVDAMVKAARDRNLDGVTLAYTKVTFSCVECHKYIRNRKVGLNQFRPTPTTKDL